MPILDTLLSTPNDVNDSRLRGKPLDQLLDGVFANLLFYAKHHWTYTASGNTGGAALLDGTATSSPCGGIATALKLAFINGLNVPQDQIEYIRVTGYLWTGPEYHCFDPLVVGNLRKLDGQDYRNGCIFNEHYYLKCNNKYFDPCLSMAYQTKDQSIKVKFADQVSVGTNRRMLIAPNNGPCFLYMPQERVHGFAGAWAMFDATKKNVEKALGSELFKTEMKAMHGASSFAKYVNTLR